MIFTSALRCKHSLNLLQRIFQNSKNKISKRPQQIFDYFLVTDFEATCNEKRNVLKPQEIIEFPVLKVDGKNFEIQSVFHEYVQPVVHKELHPFCIEKFQGWMESENLLNPEIKFAFVTYSDFDFNKMLPSQCKFLGIDVPSYMTEWIDIQKCFADETTQWPNLGLKGVLDYLNITPVGRLHSGIDDCRNTIAIMKALADRGYVFKINSTFSRKKGGEGKKNS
ncbi:ERI1 exoribonuclease 3-like isoform X3 [Centruroides vittatus]|uniref:ERI1 exoribonuclease 3-like isoform X3 n=1 Tax=Centruroides vittatus TaxID=120091 RepID=UPI00350F41F4